MLFGPEPPASAVALGDLMRSQWAAFAADGDPGWPPYAPGRRTTRIFDDPPDVAPYPGKRRCTSGTSTASAYST